MEVNSKRSCFVIASAGVELENFLGLLRSEGFDPFFISDFLKSKKASSLDVRLAFKAADFAIAFIFSGKPIENVYFEIGVALGSGRPVIVFAEPDSDVPDFFGTVEINHAPLQDWPALIPSIKQFLGKKLEGQNFGIDAGPRIESAAKQAVSDRPVPSQKKERIRKAAQEFRNVIQGRELGLSEKNLESSLIKLFQDCGILVAKREGGIEKKNIQAPDLALWLNGVEKEIGNPIAIELKSNLQSENINSAVVQLSNSLRSVNANAGILLHTNAGLRPRSVVLQTSPLVFIFSIDEIVRLLENGKLNAELKRTKNLAGA
jgi:hypothetical protein